MKLLRLKIIKADTCGGLLDNTVIHFREGQVDSNRFSPVCLIGPNGTGKSQILQIIAEIFQGIFAKYLEDEEQGTANENILFEMEYVISQSNKTQSKVLVYRHEATKRKKAGIIFEQEINGVYQAISKDQVKPLLPSKVVGYTSGDNETLSLPFFVSRAGYANQVSTNALKDDLKNLNVKDSRMLLIDYSTNLEVLVANLILNPVSIREKLVKEPNLKKLNSFRCIIQLNHTSAPKGGIKLTKDLEESIKHLKKCSTCYHFNTKTKTYTLDFFLQDATHAAFGKFWKTGALELYSCFHKLAMLNDLIIRATDRKAFERSVKERRFASRLPEPMERDKVFRFERVEFISLKSNKVVDYVSLSDGEHQLVQLLGTMCMVNYQNVLFLLDEPESHFNPRWRVEFISKIMNLETCSGIRSQSSPVAQQDCLITTHSPFVPSDMKSDNVIVFKKDADTAEISVKRPNIETYGSTFDTILEECFNISPPMSDLPKHEIEKLLQSNDIDEIKSAMKGLGDSVERMYLADRIRLLRKGHEIRC